VNTFYGKKETQIYDTMNYSISTTFNQTLFIHPIEVALSNKYCNKCYLLYYYYVPSYHHNNITMKFIFYYSIIQRIIIINLFVLRVNIYNFSFVTQK